MFSVEEGEQSADVFSCLFTVGGVDYYIVKNTYCARDLLSYLFILFLVNSNAYKKDMAFPKAC